MIVNITWVMNRLMLDCMYQDPPVRTLARAKRIIFHLMMVGLLLQSVGFLCDDCMLSTVAESCQHAAPDLGENHSHGPEAPDPCISSLCSLCGFAVHSPACSTSPIALLSNRYFFPPQLYSYTPSKELFRPPRV
jgi:hypothetical protein